MEIIEVIGVDPSLRFTGIGKLTYNLETGKFKTSDCEVLVNKTTLKGTDAISRMLELIEEVASRPNFLESDHVIVESPAVAFYAKFSAGAMVSVAHIAGGAAALFGLERVKLYRPGEWNQRQKKEKTHFITQEVLGPWETWGWNKVPKRTDQAEHVLDAVSMALWYVRKQFIEDKP